MIRATKTVDIVNQYCDEILSGEIVSCELIKQAVQKYQTEMARTDTEWPFHFNHDAADLACQFFPMLLRHSIGEWAGQPFHLSPWQSFVVWNVFGWMRQDDTRRFRKLFLSVARKNGKSTLVAGLTLLCAAADGESGAQVFIGASKIDQARIIFHEAVRMLQQSPHLGKHSTILKDNIAFASSHSFIRPLGSDKPFDGLNPSMVALDEIHSFRPHHRAFYDTMATGSGSRLQPLQAIITTAGNEKSHLYNEEATYARGVVSGDIIDHSVFGLIYELDKDDDPFDDDFQLETLIKSNPCYGISVKPEYLAEQLNEAKNKPQAKMRFIRYHANRTVSSIEGGITAQQWDEAAGELSNWKSADGIGIGVDLGGRDDLAAYAMTARFKVSEENEGQPVWRYETKAVSFMASDSRRDLTAEPFRTWIADGKLIVADYVVSELKARLIEDAFAWGVGIVAYDPWSATQLAEDLEMEGLTVVKMSQNPSSYNEPSSELLSAIEEGRFKPDINDLVLRFCATNCVFDRDSREKIMPSKKHSLQKIDSFVACLMSMKAVAGSLPRMTGSLVS